MRTTLGRVEGKLVVSEPKTDRSRRSVPLAAPLVAMLQEHSVDQQTERAAAGNQWTETGLVFTTEFGAQR